MGDTEMTDPFKKPRDPGSSNFDRVLRKGHDYNDDPFANFTYEPPKPTGHFRTFTRRNKYRAMASLNASREKLAFGSNSSICSMGSFSGSTQNLMDPCKMMNMQEDARSRKISTEVMKHRLYESVVISPRRRRFSMRVDYAGPSAGDNAELQSFTDYSRMVQSMPVTPATSQNVSPTHSPTSRRKFMFGFYSRGTTPHGMTPEEDIATPMEVEEDSWKGLAGLLKPQQRFIPASRCGRSMTSIQDNDSEDIENRLDSSFGTNIPRGLHFDPGPPQQSALFLQQAPTRRSKSPITGKDINAVAPTSY